MTRSPTSRLRVGRLDFDRLDEAACVERIFAALAAGRGGRVATVNVDQLARCRRSAAFAAFCASASIVVADGMPVVWASRLQGTPLPARVTGSDLIWSVSARAAAEDRSVFLVGGDPGAAEAAAAALVRRSSGLRVAGVVCPPAAGGDRVDAGEVRRRLVASAPEIVFVGLPSLKTQWLIEECVHLLPRAWWIGVGVSFSFVGGTVARAPRWQQRMGLEWLHRLAQDPRRLAPRYLVRDVPMASRLLAGAALRRMTEAGRPEGRAE